MKCSGWGGGRQWSAEGVKAPREEVQATHEGHTVPLKGSHPRLRAARGGTGEVPRRAATPHDGHTTRLRGLER